MTDIPIVERLTKPDAWSAHFHGGGSYTEAEEAAPFQAATALKKCVEALERAQEALTPSGETKAAYHGEFAFDLPLNGYDEDGEPLEGSQRVYVPWTTVKEIMAAIKARATLAAMTKGEE